MTSSSSSAAVRSWRTAFLTLRDETLIPPLSSAALLRDLILSQHDTLVAAATQLPPHEVTADMLFLTELAPPISDSEQGALECLRISHFIHHVCCKVRLQITISSWTFLLNFIENVVDRSLGLAGSKDVCFGTAARIKITADTLEILRLTVKVYGRNGSSSDNSVLLRILLCITSCLHVELLTAYQANETHWRGTDNGTSPKLNNLWEMQTFAFSMVGDALSRIASSISPNLWQRAVEGL